MEKETETALIFAATIIMQQVCDNPKLSGDSVTKCENGLAF